VIGFGTSKKGTGDFARGVHPPERKDFSKGAAIEAAPVPEQVFVPLHQHAGAACEPVVKVKQEVKWGDKLGEAGGFISAPVHAPINGTVLMLSAATLPTGRRVRTVPIKAAAEQTTGDALIADVLGGNWPVSGLDRFSPEAIANAVREAGVVGLGGAAFPTSVKLMRNAKRPVDTLLVNGCECEPYLTADHRLMLEYPGAVVTGALLAARAAGAERIIMAIENNKEDAAAALRKATEGTGIEVVIVHTKYPMGGERQVIPAVLGREVPTGGLPLDVGVVVINVGTAAATARAVVREKPLTHRVVTVTGAGIRTPKNVLAPIGMRLEDLLQFCGGLTADAARIVAGGPMMGYAVSDLNTPLTKGTSGITVLTKSDVRRAEETACVRCGRCVDVCPLHLVPTKAALAAKARDWELARTYHLQACCECGCCAYVCPAGIPLVQLMRMGKVLIPRE
jgi:electron transport complex protein RnfC